MVRMQSSQNVHGYQLCLLKKVTPDELVLESPPKKILDPSMILLSNKWHCNLFFKFIGLLCSSEVLFVKFPRFLALLVGLFFGHIHFHAGACYRPRKYRLTVNLITCT